MFNDPENEPREIGKLSIILCHSNQENNINLDTLPALYYSNWPLTNGCGQSFPIAGAGQVTKEQPNNH